MAQRIDPIARLGLDPAKQVALFRLRARLTWRQFMREPGQIAGLLGFLVFFLPLSLGLGIGSALGYLYLPEPWPGEILGIALVLVWLIWVLAPMLSYRLNEGLDMVRLLIFPLRRRDLLAANVAGSLFDLPSYLTLPVVIAIFVGWTTLPILPILILALIIWYAQLILTSQMVLNATGGLLRSRRFRDLTLIIFSLFGMSCYFISQFVSYLMRDLNVETLQTLRILLYLQWTPPGAAARAIERAAAGDWLLSIGWLLYAAFWLVPMAMGWWQITTRVLTGDRIFFGPGSSPKPQTKTVARAPISDSPLDILFGWLPLPIRHLLVKELLQTWRVPQRRINMIQGLAMPFIFAVIWGINPWTPDGVADGVADVSPWLFLALPVYTLLAVWAVTQNMLGWEGPGLQALLLTPIRRKNIFVGKTLGLLVQIVGTNAILAIALGAVSQNWWVIPGWITACGTALAGLAITMPASVRFAHPVNLESTSRNTTNTGGGCVTGLVNGLLIPLGAVVANLPVVALFAFIYWQNLTWIIWPAAFMSLGYGLALYALSLPYAEKLLLAYEPELIEATSKPAP